MKFIFISSLIGFALVFTACGFKETPTLQTISTPQTVFTPEFTSTSLAASSSQPTSPITTSTPLPKNTATVLSTATPTPLPTATLRPDQSVLDGLNLLLLLDTYRGLYLYDVDRRQFQLIDGETTSGYPLAWEWSPDGQVLLYRTENPAGSPTEFTLNLYNPEIGKSQVLLATNFRYFHWHPNGRAILLGNTFVDASDGVVLLEFHTEDFETAEWLRAAISPDGRRIVLTDPYANRIFITDIQLDSRNQVSGLSPLKNLNISLDGKGIMDLKWNPQSDQIALQLIDWSTNKGDVFLLNLQNRNLKNLTADIKTVKGHGMISSPLAWSPDGLRIAFTLYEQGTNRSFGNPRVFAVNVQNLEIVEITGGDFPNGKDAFWTADSQAIVYINSSNELIACRADGSEKRIVINDPIVIYYSDFRP